MAGEGVRRKKEKKGGKRNREQRRRGRERRKENGRCINRVGGGGAPNPIPGDPLIPWGRRGTRGGGSVIMM